MTWDIEEATQDLREVKLAIDVSRCMLDTQLMPDEGLTPLAGENKWGTVWVFGAGRFGLAKIFAYGRTVEEAHANFRAKLEKVGGGLEKLACGYWWAK